jgi:hypothetical protein
MRQKAHTAALMALACAVLSAAPLMAKPAASIVRSTARHAVVPSLPHELSRERVAHRAANLRLAPHTTPTQHGAALGGLASSRSKSTNKPTHAATADPAVINRVHAWEQTRRNIAAHTAIAAADAATKPRLFPSAAVPYTDTPSRKTNDPDDSSASFADTNALRTAPEFPAAEADEAEATLPPSFPVSLSYNGRGRLIVPAPLYGSRDVLLHQNQMADRDGLSRIEDDADLFDLRREKKLVALPIGEDLRVDDRLPLDRRFSRPWTAQFLAVLARDYYAIFHSPLQVNSAVRTVDFQRRLLRTNGNAAPAFGDTASPHLTGQAVDIGKGALSLTEIAWLRTYLQPLIAQGKIDVEEEFQQACFHISVYRNYLPPVPVHTNVAAGSQSVPNPSY